MNHNDLVTPADVEREIIELTARIDEAPKDLKLYHNNLRNARKAHKIAYALAYAKAGGTQMDRKMAADLETQETLTAVDIAEIEYKFARDTVDGLKAKLRALQSVSSLLKASMFGSHGGI